MRLHTVSGERGPIRFEGQFDRVNVITGPNGSGKTTVLELIGQGLAGPPRESTPFWTTLRFDRASLHRVVVDGRHEVQYTAAGHEPATKVREVERLVAATIGTGWSWNAREILGSTGPERRKALAGLLGPRMTVAAVRAALDAVEAGDSEVEWSSATQGRYETLTRLPDIAGPEYAQGWLALLRDEKNNAQQEAENARAASVLAGDRIAEAGGEVGSRAVWESKLAELDDKILTLQTQVSADEAHIKHRTRIERSIEEARQRYDRTKAQSDPPVTADRVGEFDEQLRLVTIELDLAREACRTADAKRTDARKVREELLAEERAASDRRATYAAKRREAMDNRAAAQKLAYLIRPLIDLDYIEMNDVSRPIVEELKELLDGPVPALHVEAEPDDVVPLRQRLDAAERTVNRLDAEYNQANRKANDLTAKQVAVTRERQHHIDTRTLAVGRAKDALDALPGIAAEIERLQGELAEIPPSTSQAKVELDTLIEERVGVKAKLKAVETYATLAADRDRALQRATFMADYRSDLHQTEKRAEQAIAELYRQAVAPLVEPASQITERVFGVPVTIDPVNGWSIGLGSKPVEECSESMTVVLAIALHAAVHTIQESSWRAIVVDGIESVDQENRTALVAALDESSLDNVILACVDDGWTPPRGVGVAHHPLGART